MQMPQPDAGVLARKDRLVARLAQVLPANALIQDPAETRAYECDALTAYRCAPMLAVLPASTQEVSDVLRICHEEGVPVVPRGSGTSLAGGALPTADSVILGVARMNDVLETDYDNRIIRVQTGRTKSPRHRPRRACLSGRSAAFPGRAGRPLSAPARQLLAGFCGQPQEVAARSTRRPTHSAHHVLPKEARQLWQAGEPCARQQRAGSAWVSTLVSASRRTPPIPKRLPARR